MTNSSNNQPVTKKYFDECLGKQDKKWDTKLKKQKDEIIKKISDFLNDRLLPLLDKQDKRIEQNEILLRHHDDQLDNHEQRLTTMERKASWKI